MTGMRSLVVGIADDLYQQHYQVLRQCIGMLASSTRLQLMRRQERKLGKYSLRPHASCPPTAPQLLLDQLADVWCQSLPSPAQGSGNSGV